MSLLVNIRIYDENGEYSEIELKEGKDLAGFERCRNTLYGSDLAEELGFKFLTELKKNDLYVETEDLSRLEVELKIICERIEDFSKTSQLEQNYIKSRVQNILEAVQTAKKVNGVIVIW